MDASQELAGGERRPKPEDFQIFSSAIILDRNSRICFHKCMETGALPKTNRARCRARTVSLITCWAIMRIAVLISAALFSGCAATSQPDSHSTTRDDSPARPQPAQAVRRASGSEYSPEAWAAWQKCCRIKKGMTYAEVYAILPSAGRFKIHDSHELETWFIVFENIGKDHVLMTVEYGADGRVVDIIDRNIEHGINPCVPTQLRRIR